MECSSKTFNNHLGFEGGFWQRKLGVVYLGAKKERFWNMLHGQLSGLHLPPIENIENSEMTPESEARYGSMTCGTFPSGDRSSEVMSRFHLVARRKLLPKQYPRF